MEAVIIIGVVGVAAGGMLTALVPMAKWYRHRDQQRGIRLFRLRREFLEARFFDLAKGQGKPRDLRWLDCEWQSEVRFARDRTSKLLTAFVDVNIRFEAVEGGDMEGMAAVDTVRDAVAVFHYREGVWGTGGKALFNMNSDGAIRNLAGQYDPVWDDSLQHSPL